MSKYIFSKETLFGLILGLIIALTVPVISSAKSNSSSTREYKAPYDKNITQIQNRTETNAKYSALLDKTVQSTIEGKNISQAKIDQCKSLIYRALKSLPEEHAKQVKKITFMFDPKVRRGYGGQTSIRIRCVNVEDEELVSVFTHEVGHLVDTGLKMGSERSGVSSYTDGEVEIFNDDPSTKYYEISWKATGTQLNGESEKNFCSGYGEEQDQFEDFAECYNLYIHQGQLFRQYASTNIKMRKKYFILKKYFFNGKEYGKNNKKTIPADNRVYDSTILTFNLKDFFAI